MFAKGCAVLRSTSRLTDIAASGFRHMINRAIVISFTAVSVSSCMHLVK